MFFKDDPNGCLKSAKVLAEQRQQEADTSASDTSTCAPESEKVPASA